MPVASRFNLSEWFQISVTWKFEDDLKVYLNGDLEKSAARSNVDTAFNSVVKTSFHLGKRIDAEDWYANASIDDLRIWTHEENEIQIRELFSHGEYNCAYHKQTFSRNFDIILNRGQKQNIRW